MVVNVKVFIPSLVIDFGIAAPVAGTFVADTLLSAYSTLYVHPSIPDGRKVNLGASFIATLTVRPSG